MTASQTGDVQYGVWVKNRGPVDVQDVLDCAVAAEDAGWDGVFLSDSLTWDYTEPWTLLSAIATRTQELTLATWLTPIPRRQPWQLAYALATLDRLSEGRVLLGGGLGTPSEHTRFGRVGDTAPTGEKYDEALEIIAGLWEDGEFSYDGEYYHVEDVDLAKSPVQDPRIPIVLGGWWPNEAPFERAGRWDGIMPYSPVMGGHEEGPQGEQPTGTLREETQAMLEFYHDVVDEAGEIILPYDPADGGESYRDLAREFGVTWFLETDVFDVEDVSGSLERIRRGPPD